MTTSSCEACITDNLVNDILGEHFIDENNKGWVVTIYGKILTIDKKIFFDTREQAVKAFYNYYSWRAKRAIHLILHPNDNPWSWWGSRERGAYWPAFKRYLTKNCGLKFIKL